MGASGISIWQLLIILAIILLLFGTKKLRSIGADLGSAVKGFRNSLRDEESHDTEEVQTIEDKQGQTKKTEGFSQKDHRDADFKVKSDNDLK
ncbi:twin-arginine translocation protein, TatA/E family subunit [Nitrosococcus halophilus Nc 4]|uniref:Sec-independent protein translocase protein TatA n=1 Tax=Nitrosococcus halophilus (strain Nc4) TaxID=472759 RepID=D5C482_NITHN|nr:twin-arginine translocase TatA/TatE family subunit [Nitrosococcus halophilus]ADE13270.1 twin-arginine translocation protein, TatA/E family subunit [Nitrosococcus halophilus Nc 4]